MFRNRDSPASLVSRVQFPQLILDSGNQGRPLMMYGMSVLIAFGAHLYFSVLVLLSRKLGMKKLIVMQDAVSGMRTGIAFQLVEKAWDALMKSCSLGLTFVLIRV